MNLHVGTEASMEAMQEGAGTASPPGHPDAAPSRFGPPPVAEPGAPKTILIVDDELGPREALRQILTPAYRVVTARDGREALERFAAASPDMVISDIRMPGMSGTELMTVLRRRSPETPFVLLTGYATIESAQAAVREGAFDYISKPYHVQDIRDLVARALAVVDSRREQRRALAHLQATNAQLEDEVRDLCQKATLGELSAEIVHDLNNPMSVLCGYVSLLEDSLDRDSRHASDESREVLVTMKEQIDRCIGLTRRFLDYARSSRQAWDRGNVNALLEDTFFVLRPRMRVLQVELRTTLAADLPATWLQPTPLQQAFFNLTTNALDALAGVPAPRCLSVSTRRCAAGPGPASGGARIEVSFQDNGPGVPEAIRDRVFSPFFTTKPKGKGSGLGLSICRRIVEEHGGTIVLTSEPGRGACFTIAIPVRREKPSAQAAAEGAGG
jgi:signal transduction histidine kinase